ncbi:hypothetical protein [Actinoplanes sp. L3-i22]|uniref:hypothetical protein n=1 Tax=Actinoplanes sp. L3-i22 TaxID=2836373 RepID=UPI001C77F9DA|nr:hypothetical protein [Actinoplanes sp. L3-i22]BCY15569.1 hypothetical protein L3i22_106570 [Actinoplanes sp. L3-i22]
MSPHTRYIPLAVGALLLTAACGSSHSDSRSDAAPAPSASLPSVVGLQPPVSLPPPTFTPITPGALPTWTPPTYVYPPVITPTTTTPTAAPLTKSPTPTPARAAKCSGQPTGAEILALIKGKPGIPNKTLQVQDGPFCSGTWTFTTVKLAGSGSDQQEPLSVVSTGKGSTLTLITAGSDVCNAQVQASAPAGIRVMACGF